MWAGVVCVRVRILDQKQRTMNELVAKWRMKSATRHYDWEKKAQQQQQQYSIATSEMLFFLTRLHCKWRKKFCLVFFFFFFIALFLCYILLFVCRWLCSFRLFLFHFILLLSQRFAILVKKTYELIVWRAVELFIVLTFWLSSGFFHSFFFFGSTLGLGCARDYRWCVDVWRS